MINMTIRTPLRPLDMLLIVLLALLAGCRPAGGNATPAAPEAEAEPVTLTVFAAASLTDAFNEIGAAFSAANPGVTVAFNFAGSNQLAAQIGEGAPADVFASANRKQMDAAVDTGRIAADAPRVFVTNRLVIVTPAGGDVAELSGLAAPGTLVVLAAAEVPAGQYALEFLDKAATDPTLGAGFKAAALGNVVSYEQNVRAVLNKVALGEADAGIVYASDAAGAEGVTIIDIPDALNVLAQYPIAPLSDGPNATLAAAFVTYVLGPEGQATLARYGFGMGEE